MECFRDYIGVLGCGATVPAGGKYINTLPGISLESIESLADDEQKTFLGVWADVQDRALSKFQIEINQRFAAHYKLKQIRTSTNLLKRIDLDTVHVAAAKKRGFSVELTTKNSVFIASNLQCLYVQSLSIYIIDKALIGLSAVVTVVNLDTEETIDTFTVLLANLSNGWNEIFVNKAYDANRIAFVYDATAIQSPTQSINTLAVNGFYNNVNAVYGGYCQPYIRGIEYTDPGTPSFGSDTFGLTGIFGIHCKFDNVVCANKVPFAYPLWYLLGSELMVERLSSGRINYWTTLGSDEASELFKDFYAEFDRSLTQVIESISLDGNDACLECNEKLRYVESQM